MDIRLNIITAIALLSVTGLLNAADKIDSSIEEETYIRLGSGFTITSIKHPVENFDPMTPLEPQILTRGTSYDYPTIPLAGFTPYVAVAVSDESENDELAFEHVLEHSYTGNRLSTQPGFPDMPFTIGVLDSGSETDILAGSAASALGVTKQLTGYTLPIGGIGEDTITADITAPLGFFVASLSDINSNNTIDRSDFVGHSNDMFLAAPAIECHGQEVVNSLVGRSLIGFYTTSIINDQRSSVTLDGRKYSGPKVEFRTAGNISGIPDYTKRIPIGVLDSSSAQETLVTTASFYDASSLGLDLVIPTILSMSEAYIPFGACFGVEIELTQNGRTRTYNFILDTGAQSTVITTDTADNLGLPLTGEFSVEVCGVSGSISNVPGYYIDQADIYGSGGALSFSHVPVIVSDFGTSFDGILGMNFFYDRNITLAPEINSLGASCKLYVSDPIDFADADFNNDGFVNMEDFAAFSTSWLSEFNDANYNIEHDLFLSDTVDFNDLDLFLQNWMTTEQK